MIKALQPVKHACCFHPSQPRIHTAALPCPCQYKHWLLRHLPFFDKVLVTAPSSALPHHISSVRLTDTWVDYMYHHNMPHVTATAGRPRLCMPMIAQLAGSALLFFLTNHKPVHSACSGSIRSMYLLFGSCLPAQKLTVHDRSSLSVRGPVGTHTVPLLPGTATVSASTL